MQCKTCPLSVVSPSGDGGGGGGEHWMVSFSATLSVKESAIAMMTTVVTSNKLRMSSCLLAEVHPPLCVS